MSDRSSSLETLIAQGKIKLPHSIVEKIKLKPSAVVGQYAEEMRRAGLDSDEEASMHQTTDGPQIDDTDLENEAAVERVAADAAGQAAAQSITPAARKWPPVPAEPVLRFSPLAWAALIFYRDHVDTEVGMMGICDNPADPLLVTDVMVLKQQCSAAYTEFDDEAFAAYVAAQVTKYKRHEYQVRRIWIHTHPGSSASPSGKDEQTFADPTMFARSSWSVMFIVSRSGEITCRLRIVDTTNPDCTFMRLSKEIPVRVEYQITDEPPFVIDERLALLQACVRNSSFYSAKTQHRRPVLANRQAATRSLTTFNGLPTHPDLPNYPAGNKSGFSNKSAGTTSDDNAEHWLDVDGELVEPNSLLTVTDPEQIDAILSDSRKVVDEVYYDDSYGYQSDVPQTWPLQRRDLFKDRDDVPGFID